MKKRINLQLLGVAAIAIITTIIMIVSVFYEIFRQEIFDELKSDIQLLEISGRNNDDLIPSYGAVDNLRITIIDKDGKVLFDNYTDKSKLGNHLNRPEVKEALEKGSGSIVRQSSTMDRSTFYYAVKQNNGTILRVAKEGDNIITIMLNALPLTLILSCMLFILCAVIAHFQTKSLVAPIEQMAGNINSCKNITTYKELVPFINTIQKQHEDILKSAKMRQEFTANVSHELKTPLTSISGYAELIENGMADENDTRRFAGEIHRNSNRLLNLINDIIKLSQLDDPDFTGDFEKVNLYFIAKETVELLELYAQNHDVTITLEGETCYINGNKSMLQELIYNLCDNAIRYNNYKGTVNVYVRKQKDKAVFTVKDSGIGISQKDQKRVFERFYRVDKSRSKSTGGTGLGLAIVKHVVSQHKASLNIKSEIGEGTEINIEFMLY